MPYIPEEDRGGFRLVLRRVKPDHAGDLNFCISFLLHLYLEDRNVCYQTLNEIVGVLECAKQEFLRTVVGPFEEKKRKENGDI